MILLETALLAAVVCGLHALKPKLGLAPLLMVFGLFEVFLFIAGKGEPQVMVGYFFAPPDRLASMLFMPLMLSTMVLIYDLEGTGPARRVFGALVCLYLVHGAVDVILLYHANNPPPGIASPIGSILMDVSFIDRIASLGAFFVDVVLIIVVYQFMSNQFPNLPRPLTLSVGLVLAMFSDALAYLTFTGHIFDQPPSTEIIGKLQTGLAAAVPTALYMTWYHRRWPERIRRDRSALEIIDLRRKIKDINTRYAKMRDSFQRYVSAEVVDLIAANPDKVALGGELRDVTILFADIRGYSTLSEIMAPTEIIDMLNRYFGRVGDVILAHRGMINEFEGDAVLAVFGAPLSLPDHAERAIVTALDMLSAVDDLNAEWAGTVLAERWRQAGYEGLAIRIGIHSGPVVVGNIGSSARMKYAVIGDTVNLTSRVEGLNKTLGTALLVTRASLDASKGEHLPMTSEGVHSVKGRAEPVEVFTVKPEDRAAARQMLQKKYRRAKPSS